MKTNTTTSAAPLLSSDERDALRYFDADLRAYPWGAPDPTSEDVRARLIAARLLRPWGASYETTDAGRRALLAASAPTTLGDVRVEKPRGAAPRVVGLKLDVVETAGGISTLRRTKRGDRERGYAIPDTFNFGRGYIAVGSTPELLQASLRDWLRNRAEGVARQGLDPRTRDEYLARIASWPADVAELLWNVWSAGRREVAA